MDDKLALVQHSLEKPVLAMLKVHGQMLGLIILVLSYNASESIVLNFMR